jgi:hypothetical protein
VRHDQIIAVAEVNVAVSLSLHLLESTCNDHFNEGTLVQVLRDWLCKGEFWGWTFVVCIVTASMSFSPGRGHLAMILVDMSSRL